MLRSVSSIILSIGLSAMFFGELGVWAQSGSSTNPSSRKPPTNAQSCNIKEDSVNKLAKKTWELVTADEKEKYELNFQDEKKFILKRYAKEGGEFFIDMQYIGTYQLFTNNRLELFLEKSGRNRPQNMTRPLKIRTVYKLEDNKMILINNPPKPVANLKTPCSGYPDKDWNSYKPEQKLVYKLVSTPNSATSKDGETSSQSTGVNPTTTNTSESPKASGTSAQPTGLNPSPSQTTTDSSK